MNARYTREGCRVQEKATLNSAGERVGTEIILDVPPDDLDELELEL